MSEDFGHGFITVCITCQGRAVVPRIQLGGMSEEICRTCQGEGVYDWRTGPGVDHNRPHGTGIHPAS